MPRPLRRGILGPSTTILSKDIDEYAFMCGLNFYETDVMINPFFLPNNSVILLHKKTEFLGYI